MTAVLWPHFLVWLQVTVRIALIPSSLLSETVARKLVGGNCDSFDKYKCCPCFSLYQWLQISDCKNYIPLCIFQNLLATHEIKQNSCLIYCYKSIVQSLKEFFFEKCELWRRCNVRVYTDDYDGQIYSNIKANHSSHCHLTLSYIWM